MTKVSIDEDKPPIVHLETLNPGKRAHNGSRHLDLLCIYENGELRCLTENLGTELWRASLSDVIGRNDLGQEEKTKEMVEYVTTVDANKVHEGLLSKRHDVQTLLRDDSSHTPSLLLLVTRQLDRRSKIKQERMIYLSIVQSAASDSHQTGQFGRLIYPVMATVLSTPSDDLQSSNSNSLFAMDFTSGQLRLLKDDNVTTYDLNGTTPVLLSKLPFHQRKASSFINITPSLVMCASQKVLKVYDATYNTLQASNYMDNLSDAPSERNPESSQDQDLTLYSNSSIKLLSYFRRSGLAVAFSDGNMVAFQIEGVPRKYDGHLVRADNSQLIESIGRGVNSSEPQVGSLERLAREGNVQEFEVIFSKEVGIVIGEVSSNSSSTAQTAHSPRRNMAPSEVNGWELIKDDPDIPALERSGINGGSQKSKTKVVDMLPQEWEWPNPGDKNDYLATAVAKQSLVDIALAVIFGRARTNSDTNGQGSLLLKRGQPSKLMFRFFPPNVVHWLLQSGSISKLRIERVLDQHNNGNNIGGPLANGELIRAFLDYDPSFNWLLSLLSSPVYLDSSEIVHAVKYLVCSFRSATGSQDFEVYSHSDGNQHLVNGGLEDAVAQEQSAAEEELNIALWALESNTGIKEQALSLALTKLNTFSPSLITQALRTELSKDEIIEVVQLLRMQLAGGGWISLYHYAFEQVDLAVDHEPSEQHITIISNLLNCALDSIGIGGWVFGDPLAEEREMLDDLIPSLKSEISAALEGVEEATYLKGIMDQFLLYSRSVSAASFKRELPTLRPEALAMLPLSLKAEEDVPKSKTLPDGTVLERSVRDIKRLKSMQIGEYTRESIFM